MSTLQANSFYFIDNEKTEDLFSQLLQNSPNLSELCLRNVSDKAVMHIVASACRPSLTTINVWIDSLKAIESLCRACPNLRSLHIWNKIVDTHGDEVTQIVVRHCPLIEVLATDWTLTDAGLNSLSTLHTLSELSLCTDATCTSAAVQRVLSANPTTLVTVKIAIYDIDDALVRCIGKHCRNLKSLELYLDKKSPYLSNETSLVLFGGCPLLQSFYLDQSGRVSNVVLRTMFECCHHLTELDIDDNAFFDAPLPVGGPVLYSPYPCLTKLKVTCDCITASALHDIFTYCTNLRDVNCDCCDQVDGGILKTLIQNCRCLCTLYLRGCTNVTMAGVLEVATHCPTLKSLTLKFMPISDDVLIQLSLSCPNLTSLDLSFWDGESITEAGILAVIERCMHLSSLTICGSLVEVLLSTLDLAKLRQSYPHITVAFEKR